MLITLSKRIAMQDMKLMDANSTDHPNKVPFKCSLFAVDKPSDGSPEGAGGKLIRISSEVCDQYLSTFEGMGMNIDYSEGMANHDERFKVGIITKLFRSLDGFAMAEGYIWGKDFPDVVATIRYYNGLATEYEWDEYQFGTSIEMEASVTTAPDDQNVLDVIEFCGTGAAILFADSAAFKTTSFAARNNQGKGNEEEMKPEEIKAMLDGFANTITASVADVKAEVGTVKAEVDKIKAASEEKEQKEAESKAESDLKAAEDRAVKAEQELEAIKAATANPQRKTATPAQLLAKFDATNAGDGAVDLKSFNATVDALNLPTNESMKLKIQAKSIFKEGE